MCVMWPHDPIQPRLEFVFFNKRPRDFVRAGPPFPVRRGKMASKAVSSWFFTLMQREPIIMWSFFLGGTGMLMLACFVPLQWLPYYLPLSVCVFNILSSAGIALPLIVPPITNIWAGSAPRPPVSPLDVRTRG